MNGILSIKSVTRRGVSVCIAITSRKRIVWPAARASNRVPQGRSLEEPAKSPRTLIWTCASIAMLVTRPAHSWRLNRVYFDKSRRARRGQCARDILPKSSCPSYVLFIMASKELSRLNEPLPVGPTPSGQQAFFMPLIS